MNVLQQVRALEHKRRKIHRELTREWDEEHFIPEMAKLRKQCDHSNLVTVLMVTKEYARIRCCCCGKEVWHGQTDTIPSEYKHVRISDF